MPKNDLKSLQKLIKKAKSAMNNTSPNKGVVLLKLPPNASEGLKQETGTILSED